MAGRQKNKLDFQPEDYKLCYVSDYFAYFTTSPLDKQTGDDWNDIPYEHNAGTPYVMEGHKIIKIAFDAHLDLPNEGHFNSPFSVDMINAGAIAWLRSSQYSMSDKTIIIPAGTIIPKFIELVEQVGDVYVPYKLINCFYDKK